MRYFILLLFSVLCLNVHSFSQGVDSSSVVDPNFHIYICFGQSNMEGNAVIGDDDRTGVNERFQMMSVAAGDFEHLGRSAGTWYTANPPLCRWDTGLTPADYCGRTLVDSLPDSIRVGVIVIAMGGSGIDAFDKDNYTSYYNNADAWQKSLMNIYDGNPYAKIVEMASLAQQSGVIKGILLHQGETNNGQTDWPLKVRKIYYDLLNDLDIEPNSIPLLAGEMLHQEQGGICWGMNSIIATLPDYIPNSHVISSEGCEGNGIDGFHFSTNAARELGKRYGLELLDIMKNNDLENNQKVDHLNIDNANFTMLTGTSRKVPLVAVFENGLDLDISYKATYEISNPEVVKISNGIIETVKDGEATVTAYYTSGLGDEKQVTFNVVSTTFPLTNDLFNAKIWENGTFDESTHTLKTGQWGFGGWQYKGVDFSGYKYLVVRLGSDNKADVEFKLFDGNSYWGSSTSSKFGSKSEIVVNLKTAKKGDGTALELSHIYIAGFWSNGSNPFVIDTVFLSNSAEFDPPMILVEDASGNNITELNGFHYKRGEGPSVAKEIAVSGEKLSSDILLQVSAGFELALDSTQEFASKITLEQIDGAVSDERVFIRMKAGLNNNSYNSVLNITSSGAESIAIKLQGTTEQGTGIYSTHSEGTVVSTTYYTLNGVRVSDINNRKGVFIAKETLSNGAIQTKKIVK